MLVEFKVRNYGPFRDWTSLSMQATALKDMEGNVVPSTRVKGGILTSVAVFGSNASGKTLLFEALRTLSSLTSDVYEEGHEYPWYNPFRLDRSSRASPTDVSVALLLDDVLYEYNVSYDRSSVTAESLYHYPRGRRSRVFERTSPTAFGTGTKKAISGMTSPSSTYLTVASRYNDSLCGRVRRALGEIIFLSGNSQSLVARSCHFVSGDDDKRRMLLGALEAADLGITDFDYTEELLDPEKEALRVDAGTYYGIIRRDGAPAVSKTEVFLRHDFPKADVDDSDKTFKASMESSGTRNMFGISGPMVDALVNGRLLVIDEFGAFLHPLLTRWIVEQFRGENNPNHAQLLVNTHDLGLMDTDDLLRRDQVWFTDRDLGTGESEAYCLSDFNNVRKDTDVLKAYLLGRFNALPNVRRSGVMR